MVTDRSRLVGVLLGPTFGVRRSSPLPATLAVFSADTLRHGRRRRRPAPPASP